MTDAVAALSNGVQVGLRIPVILISLIGVVFVLLVVQKIGPVAAVLGALGSLFIAADQAMNIVWVLHISAITKETEFDADHMTSVNNGYTIADAVLITIGAALVVAAIVMRRTAAVPTQPGFGGPGQPGQFAPHAYPPQPGYPPQPQSAPPTTQPPFSPQ